MKKFLFTIAIVSLFFVMGCSITTTKTTEITEVPTTQITTTVAPSTEGPTTQIPTTEEQTTITTQTLYEVIFNSMGGTEVESVFVGKGNTISIPYILREGYTLDGWYTSLNGGQTFDEKWSFTTFTVNNNITLYAKWIVNQYTITFNSNESSVVNSITQDYNSTVIEPDEPTREGYTFIGWFSDEELTIEYTFNTMPAEDITLYAKWQINQYTLSILDYDDSIIYQQAYDYNTDLSVLVITDPTREGYTFIGWDQVIPTIMPASDEVIQAIYEINPYTITFNSNEGSVVNSITQDYNSAVIEPDEPTREGYTFIGWFSDEESTLEYTFTAMSSYDITLYARWIINQYTISFNSNNGNDIDKITQDYATDVVEPTEPMREGYTFDGWYSDELLATEYIFTTMPATDITLYAKWQINEYALSYYNFADFNPLATISLFSGEIITSIQFGELHSSAITSFGRIFTWGNNVYGQLGIGISDYNIHSVPSEITKLFNLEDGEKIISISLGSNHSSAITSFNRIFTWGENGSGKLGDGTNEQRNIPTEITDQFNLLVGEVIESISLGNDHSSALTSMGRIFTWGSNSVGQLGNGTNTPSNTPIEITSLFNLIEGEKIIEISLSFHHSSALTSLGRIFTWGNNDVGQLGDGTNIQKNTPTEITSFFNLSEGEKIISVSISSSRAHSSALTSFGRIFTWGYNIDGQLGDGTTSDGYNLPIDITNHFSLEIGEKIVSVSLGGLYSSAITSTGRVFTWGYNGAGQLGDGSITSSSNPIDITSRFNLENEEKIASISLGFYHSAAITSLNRVFIWGYSNYGQLGDGTTTTKYSPTEFHFNHPILILRETNIYNTNINGYEPVLQGYTLMGWYSDSQLTKIYTFGTMPAEDITLYAKWTINQYTLSILDYDDSIIYEEIYDYNTDLSGLVIIDPIREGYTFIGWDQVLPRTMPANDVTIKAQYSINQYTISFNSNEGSDVSSITQDYATVVIKPIEPTREGYTFIGWFIDEALTSDYTFTTMPAEDIILYAKWQYFDTFKDAIAMGKGSYVTIHSVTCLGFIANGYYFTDGVDILFVYVSSLPIEPGDVVDLTGVVGEYYGYAQLAGSDEKPILITPSDAEAKEPIVIEATIDWIMANCNAITGDMRLHAMYQVSGRVYYASEYIDPVYLVPSDYDFVNNFNVTAKPFGAAIEIYDYSNDTLLIPFHGKEVTINIIPLGFHSGHSNHHANFIGGTSDIIVSIENDAEAVQTALDALVYPGTIVEDTTLEFPAMLYGVTLEYVSDNAAINVLTGFVDAASQTEQVTVTITVTATRGAVTDTKDIVIKVGELPVSTLAEVLAAAEGTLFKVQATIIGGGYGTYHIQDATGAIGIYASSAVRGTFAENIGNVVEIVGIRGSYNGLQQISAQTIVFIEEGTLPTPINLDDLEINSTNFLPYQSHMIELTGMEVVTTATDSNNNITLTLKNLRNGTTIVAKWDSRFVVSTEFAAQLAALVEGDIINIQAILGWFLSPQITISAQTVITMTTVAEKLAADAAWLPATLETTAGATETAPLVGPYGSTIVWDVTEITAAGGTYDPVTGEVMYPMITETTVYNVVGTLTLGEETPVDVTLAITVLAMTEAEKVAAAVADTSIDEAVDGYQVVMLPLTGLYGTTISWTIVSGDATLDVDGTTLTYHQGTMVADVVLDATFTNGLESQVVQYTVTVTPVTIVTDLSTIPAMANGTMIYVQGVVTGISYDGAFIQDANGVGFFLYQPADKTSLTIGDEVVYYGAVAEYSGAKQLGFGGVYKELLSQGNALIYNTVTADEIHAFAMADAGSLFTFDGFTFQGFDPFDNRGMLLGYTLADGVTEGTVAIRFYSNWSDLVLVAENYSVGDTIPAVNFILYNFRFSSIQLDVVSVPTLAAAVEALDDTV